MEITFNHNFYVLNIDENFNYDFLESQIIDKLTNYYYPKTFKDLFISEKGNNIEALEFNLIYNNVEKILLYKKKRAKSTLKQLSFTFHIPVPKNSDVTWGIPDENFLSNNIMSKILLDDFEILDYPEYENCSNIEDYFIQSIILGIKKTVGEIPIQ
ncbi:Imm9 family immunity protein [Flavobacterium procerum]|uniref:Imm9 family immunity protein n=1 Tax=Flavobacterium procerum TaxID=1455569 RepID=A0ABV6BPT7_9FLAO